MRDGYLKLGEWAWEAIRRSTASFSPQELEEVEVVRPEILEYWRAFLPEEMEWQ
ncbi:MAG: hypothetical protein AOA65_1854 [Candidatus Bathyarchaeota archaeon BA1]|nr:MAG: hypothetical protein AOA65_1854 [Candidatus Bathyarchaeota archaeon BA1]